MKKLDEHITSITNGNSRRLAYYIATGVVALVLNFTLSVVDKVIESNKKSPTQVYEQVVSMKDYEKEQTVLLREISKNMALMHQAQMLILSEKMENR